MTTNSFPLITRPRWGFVTQNSIRTLNAYQGYQYFFDKEDFLKQFNIELESELTYNYNNLRKFLSFDASTNVQLDNNIRSPNRL